ncbi:MAG: N-acetyltransferase family protein [Oscillibacter sp.]|nr:N-acetyltransferase family protein [Oscillibacter sp.]
MHAASITIRTAAEADAPRLLEIYAPYVRKTAITFEYELPTEEEFAARIRRVLKRYPYLVAENEGQILGYAYASAFHTRAAYDWAVESSIYMDKKKKRMGLGRRLYEKLKECLLAQGVLNVNASIAYLEQPDEYLTADSVAFHTRLGCRAAGQLHFCGYKFGRWYHTVFYGKAFGPPSASAAAGAPL